MIAGMPLVAFAACHHADIDNRSAEVLKILTRMREIRDSTHFQPLRKEYNKACDRLDILHSKIIQAR